MVEVVPVDEVDPEGEVSVVDIEAVGALVHGTVTPLGGLGTWCWYWVLV